MKHFVILAAIASLVACNEVVEVPATEATASATPEVVEVPADETASAEASGASLVAPVSQQHQL